MLPRLLRRAAAVLAAAVPACLLLDPATAGAVAARPPVVLIGVPALAPGDLSATGTPNLWRLADSGSSATLSVRTVGTWTCPADGWLTVSAGARAALPKVPCGQPPAAPVPAGTGWRQDVVPHARSINMASNFRAGVGTLGDEVHRSGGCTAAVGPGATLAAADSNGRFDAYAATPAQFTGWGRCAFTAVELTDVVTPYLGTGTSPHTAATVTPATRAAAVRAADAQVGRILAALPAGANVIVAGLSDQSDVPHLRMLAATGPGFPAGRWLRSPATRRDGMTILPDLTATVLHLEGLPIPAQVVGAPLKAAGASGGVRELAGQDVAAQTLRVSIQGFFVVLVVCQLLAYGIAAVALRGERRTGRRRRILAVARAIALAGAAVPVSTYLANLLPWRDWSDPVTWMFALIAAFDLALLAAALGGPWRRSVLAPGTVISGVTSVTLAVDLLRGSPLQMNSLMGYSPLVGGRYYGLSNIAFATFATGTLFFAAGIAHLLTRRGHRGWAVAVVIALGLGADALSGAPAIGAKFGGTIALIPGTAVTALIVAGKRVTPLRVLAAALTGVATIFTICYLDYLRPPDQRTHLGRFAQQLLDGDARPVVTRKMLAMLHTVGNIPLTLLVAGGAAFLFFVLLRGGLMAAAYERAPALRAALTGTLVCSMSGFAVEDSGIAVPAIALTLSVPLAFAAVAGVRRLSEDVPAVPAPREPAAETTAAEV